MSLSTENRNATYIDIVGGLPEKRLAVYKSIEWFGFASIENICDQLSSPKNEVSGRITELKSLYLIREIGSEKSKKNHSQTVYSIVHESEREGLMIESLHENKRISENLEFNLSRVSGFANDVLVKEIDKLKSKINQIEKLLNNGKQSSNHIKE